MIKVGDYVTRKSYNNDIVFEVVSINENNFLLRGIDFRLEADSVETDLSKVDKKVIEGDDEYAKSINDFIKTDRDEFFYLPGKVLHIDSDTHLCKLTNNHSKTLMK